MLVLRKKPLKATPPPGVDGPSSCRGATIGDKTAYRAWADGLDHRALDRQNTRLFDRPCRPWAGPQETDSVANIKSAEKRAHQAVKRRAHNMAARSRLRSSIKKVLTAVGAGDHGSAAAALKAAQPVIDTMVTKGIIHANKAARHKRELNAKVKALAQK
jgi:small subunit ribosomal protein S20